ncbi:protein Mdm4 isoform X2 [Trichomycterus rosablanca]|uniref:protein Mdm4 isoform X2 n=1 Tax=Trichomycterus rosablanca TaxID=2290929 RepID=UPI002F35AF29
MMSLSSSLALTSAHAGVLPAGETRVKPMLPLLQILWVAGAQGTVFTLKEVIHHLGQYIMIKKMYDQQQQHIVYCRGDPLGELLQLESFSVRNPSPIYEMLKRNLLIVNCPDAAKNVSVDKESSLSPCEDPGQVSGGTIGSGQGGMQNSSQRRPRDEDSDLLDGLPTSACKRPKLDLSIDDSDMSGLPWWFLDNLHSGRSNGSTDLVTNQEGDTAIVSDDRWALTEPESEQMSVEMKEAALEQGTEPDFPQEEEGQRKGRKEDKEIEDELNDDSQCVSDDTDTEISSPDAWQCSECHKFNSSTQRYCMRCWALRKDWYKDCLELVQDLSRPEGRKEDEDGIDVPDCPRTVSAPVLLPSHCASRNLPTLPHSTKGKAPCRPLHSSQESQEDREALLQPCMMCRMRPRDGNIIHGRTAHLLTCFFCARKLHKSHSPCPGCGQIIQKVIKTYLS